MASAEKIKRMNDYIALHPSSTAFARLAEAYAEAGELERSLKMLERGLKEHPRYLPALILKARYLLVDNQPFKAEEILRQALSIDPSNVTVLRMLLNLEAHREAAGRGMTARKLAAMDSDNQTVHRVLSEESRESSPFATRSVADLYESQGYITEALRIYRELARQKPDDDAIAAKIKELERRIDGTKTA